MMGLRLRRTALRRILLALYGFGAVGALWMASTSISDARLPWFIVAMFSAGCFIDVLMGRDAAVAQDLVSR